MSIRGGEAWFFGTQVLILLVVSLISCSPSLSVQQEERISAFGEIRDKLVRGLPGGLALIIISGGSAADLPAVRVAQSLEISQRRRNTLI